MATDNKPARMVFLLRHLWKMGKAFQTRLTLQSLMQLQGHELPALNFRTYVIHNKINYIGRPANNKRYLINYS